jgi:hypothetical protein
MVPIIIIIFLTYVVLHKIVTNVEFRCLPVDAPSGNSAINIRLQLGMTPVNNIVTGTIVCLNGVIMPNRQLPSLYCPRAFGGRTEAVVEFIEQLCPQDVPLVVFPVDAVAQGPLRRSTRPRRGPITDILNQDVRQSDRPQ